MAQQQHTRITGTDIAREPSLDFSDDGTRFEGYLYKGTIPIHRAAGTGSEYCFISVRYDYTHGVIPRSLWKFCDYFNYVPREKYDRKVLVAMCEYLYQRYYEKNPHPYMDGLPDSQIQILEDLEGRGEL